MYCKKLMKQEKWILYISVVFIVAAMVMTAELLHEKEIIFPEITALAVGALVAPKRSWQTNRTLMVALIAVCSTGGVLIVRCIPLALWAQMLLAFAICQLLYLFSRTAFAPMISAMVLPVLLGTTSWVYPVSAVAMTVIIVALQFFFEKCSISEKEPFSPTPLPSKRDSLDMLLRIILAGILIFAAVSTGWQLCVAPPLLVAFTEFSRRNCKARKTPVKTILLVSLCAGAGALCRWTFSIMLGLPLALAAAAATAVTLLLMKGMKQYLPPAGAMAILPMLLPQERVLLFPVQAFIGVSALMGIALLFFRNNNKAPVAI